MNRSSTERGGLYRHTNPPPSREVALQRLEELESGIESMNTQLQHSTADEQDDKETFERWKRGVISAISHYRTEATYLRGWLGISVGTDRVILVKSSAHKMPDDFVLKFQTMKLKADQMTVEMKSLYARVYVEGHLPTDVEQAQDRREQLTTVRKSFLAKFQELNVTAKEVGLSEDTMVNVRRSLTNLYSEFIAESKLLSTYLRENRASEPRVEWKEFLLSVVDEAISKGFNPSNQQTKVLEEIRAFIANRNALLTKPEEAS